MYLSLLHANLRDRDARRAIGDCRLLHTTLMQAFPTLPAIDAPRAAVGLLYRIERARGPTVSVLAQSLTEPDWTVLPTYWVAEEPKPLAAAYGMLREGQTLTFRLRANPTKIAGVRPDGGDLINRHRVALTDPTDQIEWLQRAGERGGFAPAMGEIARHDMNGTFTGIAMIPNVRVRPEPLVHSSRGAGSLTFGAVLYEGRIVVTDTPLFRATLVGGVGRGKAFGFGLLSIAPSRGVGGG